jgi:hypothetical protein
MRRRAHLLRRILLNLRAVSLFAVIGVALGIVAWTLLPMRVQPSPPVPPTLFLHPIGSNIKIFTVHYFVSGTGRIRHVKVFIEGRPLRGKDSSPALLFITPKVATANLSPAGGSLGRGGFYFSFTRRTIFSVSFDVINQPFGYVEDGLQAAVAIPALTYDSPVGAPTLLASFDVPDAGQYDWSADPPNEISDAIYWRQTAFGGTLPSRIAIGIDHAEQSTDDRDTFIAGALIGLAGAALIAALQEALHTQLTRQRKRGNDSNDDTSTKPDTEPT